MLDILDRLIYRDGMILVINKPAGWNCTPSGPGIHLTSHLSALTLGKTTLPQVAHRLDCDTTGCLVLGRHARALRILGQLFQEHKIKKTYWALVQGCWPASLMQLDQQIQGKAALTWVRCLQVKDNISWLELQPQTGRTHQIRLHCAGQGYPILGDYKYGGGRGPLFLHAYSLEIPLYTKRPAIYIKAPLPSTWMSLIPGEAYLSHSKG